MSTGFLKGTGVALVTPFNDDFAVDYNGLENLLAYHTENGTDYLVIHGTTGESPTTSNEEKNKIIDFVKAHNPSNLPVISGIGGNNTLALLEQIKSTDFEGISALLSVSPYYNKPSQAGIINHYELIANVCPVPVILYNVPGRTASNMTAETTLTLAQHQNIVAMKEASGDLKQCREIVEKRPDDFHLISGDDMLTVEIIKMGGSGVISVLANAFPHLFKAVTDLALSGDYEGAEKKLESLKTLNPLIYKESSGTGIKIVLNELGLCESVVRPPLFKGSETLTSAIRSAMEDITVNL